jgi:hypothetical protein
MSISDLSAAPPLQAKYGANADIRALQHAPRNPVQALFARLAEIEAKAPEFAEEKAAVKEDPYLAYVVTKKEKCECLGRGPGLRMVCDAAAVW